MKMKYSHLNDGIHFFSYISCRHLLLPGEHIRKIWIFCHQHIMRSISHLFPVVQNKYLIRMKQRLISVRDHNRCLILRQYVSWDSETSALQYKAFGFVHLIKTYYPFQKRYRDRSATFQFPLLDILFQGFPKAHHPLPLFQK